MNLSIAEARQLALYGQMLDSEDSSIDAKKRTADVIRGLSYIQIDTIAVVARAHHHVLWSRCPTYNSDILHVLQVHEKQVFEYWGHAASILPMEDFRFSLPRKHSLATSESKWMKRRREAAGHLLGPVLERIRSEGPLSSKDFEAKSDERGGTWWDWKPAKIALEILFWQGDLMVRERVNFQKVYDLTERVLPASVNQEMPSEEEYGRFLVRRTLRSYGIAQAKDIRRHLHSSRPSPAMAAMKQLLEQGEIVALMVENDSQPSYAFTEMLDRLHQFPTIPPRAWLLSPFDNLIIQRERLERLFGFRYALECYLPREKRTYGYFVLPILFGDAFIGRLDAKAERQARTLVLNGFWLEDGVSDDSGMWNALAANLTAFMHFNQCDQIEFRERAGQVSTKRLLTALAQASTRVGLSRS